MSAAHGTIFRWIVLRTGVWFGVSLSHDAGFVELAIAWKWLTICLEVLRDGRCCSADIEVLKDLLSMSRMEIVKFEA